MGVLKVHTKQLQQTSYAERSAQGTPYALGMRAAPRGQAQAHGGRARA